MHEIGIVMGKRSFWIAGSLVLVVAVAIIVALPLRSGGDRPKLAARHKLTVIAGLLQQWHEKKGTYPTDIRQLEELLAADIPTASRERLSEDPWGNRITYRLPSMKPSCAFDLYSNGPNGRDDGGDGDDV